MRVGPPTCNGQVVPRILHLRKKGRAEEEETFKFTS